MASRRKVLKGVLFLGAAWAIVARPWTWVMAPDLTYQEIEGLAPFRSLATGGEVSGGGDPSAAIFAGLNDRAATDPVLEQSLRDSLTEVLWGDWDGTGPVPVTYFTDINCPICRVLERRLAVLDGIALTTREYPIFGETSEQAARAILAAGRQGAAEAMRHRLQRAPMAATDAIVEGAARSLSLDLDQFAADLAGPQVAARLAEDRALAGIFQLPGTPALVVGRTRIVGLVALDVLQAVVDAEHPVAA